MALPLLSLAKMKSDQAMASKVAAKGGFSARTYTHTKASAVPAAVSGAHMPQPPSSKRQPQPPSKVRDSKENTAPTGRSHAASSKSSTKTFVHKSHATQSGSMTTRPSKAKTSGSTGQPHTARPSSRKGGWDPSADSGLDINRPRHEVPIAPKDALKVNSLGTKS